MQNKADGEKTDLEAQVAALQSSATTTTSATTSATADETTDWETYANEKYGFSFKYPETMIVSDTLDSSGNFSVSEKVTISDSRDSMDLWANPDGFGPFFADYQYEATTTESGVSVTSKEKTTSEDSSDNTTFAITQFTEGSNKYLVHYKISGSDNEPLARFDQILSTFQFTSK
jgi:hypothetical protein